MSEFFDKYYGHIGTTVSLIAFVVSSVVPENYRNICYLSVGILSLAYFAFYLGRKSAKPNLNFDDSLIAFFRGLQKENQHQELIRFGDALSTPVWLSLKYHTRVTLGEYIHNSAIIVGDIGVRIKVLIDDIGWTKVELGLYEDAEESICRGVELAEKNTDYFYVSKGYRHLCGLYTRQGRIDDAERFLEKAIEFTNKVNGDPQKRNLMAEIRFNKSSIAMKRKEYGIALEEIKDEFERYEKEEKKEWTIKVLSKKGEILLKLNKVKEAKELFIEGLAQSEKYHYNKQIVKNLMGLAKCSVNGNLFESKNYLERAHKLATDIGMYHEKFAIQAELESIGKTIAKFRSG